MRNSARSGARAIRKYSQRHAPEQVANLGFRYIANEIDSSVSPVFFFELCKISTSLGVVAAGHDKFHIGNLTLNSRQCLKQVLKALVCSPASKRQYSVSRGI